MSSHKSSKIRRYSGRVTPRNVPGTKISLLMRDGIEPQVFWDDWSDYRDGYRGSKDKTRLRSLFSAGAEYLQIERWNNKIKKLIKRRQARKDKSRQP